jgi:hypothetical protein
MRAGALVLVAAGCLSKPHSPAGSDGGPTTVDAPPDAGPPTNVVFVTSMSIAPKLIGGVLAADSLCHSLAMMAGMPPGHYQAWLSTSTQNAADRLRATGARGWTRTDGKPFADDVDHMTQNEIFYPVLNNELGAPIGAFDRIVTGTNADGTAELGPGGPATCADWKADDGLMVQAGYAYGTSFKWTAGDHQDCNTPARLYCFQTDFNQPVRPPKPALADKIAFATSMPAANGQGLMALDAQCDAVGKTQYPVRNFKALVATVGNTAASRFAIDLQRPWVRPDGAIASTDLITLQAPISQAVDGTYIDVAVLVGAIGPNDPPTGTPDTCNDWTSTAPTDHGLVGVNDYVLPAGFGSSRQTCDMTLSMYCIER